MSSERSRTSSSSRRVRIAAALTLCALALPAAAGGWVAAAIDLLDAGQRRAPVMSINDAASRAQDRFGGQVISISPAEQDGRRGYRVKILLESGRVKTLFVEARTGDVIDRRGRVP